MTTKSRKTNTPSAKTKTKSTTAPASRRSRKPQAAAGGNPSRQRVEEEIADRIIELLDKGELPPWEKGWRNSKSGDPVNALTMKPYRGINRWLTLITQQSMGYDDPRWLTYRQAEGLGGHVRKGEKSTSIIFWKQVPFRQREDGDEAQNQAHAQTTETTAARRTRAGSALTRCSAPTGCSTWSRPRTARSSPFPRRRPPATTQSSWPRPSSPGCPDPPQMEFYENANYVPHYQPATDVIRVPKMSRYLNLEDYYNTVFHELTHATGHSKRLDRFSQDANADDLHAYGREELTAAMGSAMLAAHAGIEAELVERDASYIRHWRDTINADKPMIIRSATLAQKAVDLILGEKPPEFLPNNPQPQPEDGPEEPQPEEPNPVTVPENPQAQPA